MSVIIITIAFSFSITIASYLSVINITNAFSFYNQTFSLFRIHFDVKCELGNPVFFFNQIVVETKVLLSNSSFSLPVMPPLLYTKLL